MAAVIPDLLAGWFEPCRACAGRGVIEVPFMMSAPALTPCAECRGEGLVLTPAGHDAFRLLYRLVRGELEDDDFVREPLR